MFEGEFERLVEIVPTLQPWEQIVLLLAALGGVGYACYLHGKNAATSGDKKS